MEIIIKSRLNLEKVTISKRHFSNEYILFRQPFFSATELKLYAEELLEINKKKCLEMKKKKYQVAAHVLGVFFFD